MFLYFILTLLTSSQDLPDYLNLPADQVSITRYDYTYFPETYQGPTLELNFTGCGIVVVVEEFYSFNFLIDGNFISLYELTDKSWACDELSNQQHTLLIKDTIDFTLNYIDVYYRLPPATRSKSPSYTFTPSSLFTLFTSSIKSSSTSESGTFISSNAFSTSNIISKSENNEESFLFSMSVSNSYKTNSNLNTSPSQEFSSSSSSSTFKMSSSDILLETTIAFDKKDKKKNSKTLLIVGITLGCFAFVAIVLIIIVIYVIKRKKVSIESKNEIDFDDPVFTLPQENPLFIQHDPYISKDPFEQEKSE